MNMKKLLIVFSILLVAFALSGCKSEASYDNYGDDYVEEDTTPEAPAPEVVTPELDGGDVVQTAAVPALLNRKIIYTAGLSMLAPEPEVVYNNIIDQLDTFTAYVESADITTSRYTVKIRVLSVNFTAFVEEIKTSGDVVSYSKTSEDVTNSYSTFEARKLALETQHTRILELIADAVDLSDILTLEDARFELETELNEIGEALANFDSLVDYSTINVTINRATELVVILPATTTPTIFVVEYTKNTAEIEVLNRSDEPAIIYLDVLQNGEFVRQYDGEAFADSKVVFEIDELDSNKEYTFKATAISAEHRVSTTVTREVLTESTFFNKIGNTFEGSFTALVSIFEFVGLAIVAIAPFVVVFAILFIPSRILYKKYLKKYLKDRTTRKNEIIDNRKVEQKLRETEMRKRYQLKQQQIEAQNKKQ